MTHVVHHVTEGWSRFTNGSDKSVAERHMLTSNGGGYGLALAMRASGALKQNTITRFATGINVTHADKATLEANTVTNAANFGIYLRQTSRANLKKNTTNFANYGIYSTTSTTTIISEQYRIIVLQACM